MNNILYISNNILQWSRLMNLNKMESEKVLADTYTRNDSEQFGIMAVFYHTPPDYNQWFVFYNVTNDNFGRLTYTLAIPKVIALTSELAAAIVRGSAYEHLRTCLEVVDKNGKYISPYISPDKWLMF